MGLRITNNLSALTALRNLKVNDRNQVSSLERLATGVRINRASDDPSGLVISERLRAQVSSLRQSVRNAEDAGNLISTGESALQEIANLLSQVRESAVFAANDGVASADEIAAEQATVDSALVAIDQIARTTRFGTKGILNGESDFSVQQGNDQFARVELQSVNFAGASERTLNFSVAAGSNAQRAEVRFSAPGAGTRVIRVSGNRGSVDVTIASGVSGGQAASIVNTFRDVTGVFASANGDRVAMLSGEFGSDQFVRVDVLEGNLVNVEQLDDTFTLVSAPAAAAGNATPNLVQGASVVDNGKDVVAEINGLEVQGRGVSLRINNELLSGEFELRSDDDVVNGTGSSQGSNSTVGFSRDLTILNSGIQFQLNVNTGDSITIGIRNSTTSNLGERAAVERGGAANAEIQGFLNSLKTGGDNDLFTNANNAINVLDTAIDQVSRQRAFLGGFKAFTLDTNISALSVAIENIQATESTVRDLDFAEESANFTRTQILFQAATSVLANANLIPQNVLTLLT